MMTINFNATCTSRGQEREREKALQEWIEKRRERESTREIGDSERDKKSLKLCNKITMQKPSQTRQQQQQ